MKCPVDGNMRMKTISIGFVALLLLSFVMVVFPPVSAEHPAQAIWVEPASTVLEISENFTIDVKINITSPTLPGGGTGLFGFTYMLKWNSTILEATSIRFHSPWSLPPSLLIKNQTGVTPDGYDYHWLAITAVAGSTPFTGVTSLCTYTFHVISNGASPLDLRLGPASTTPPIIPDYLLPPELTDDTGTVIDVTVVDGYFSDPFPRASFTYSPEFPLVDEMVTFNASDSYDPDGTIVSYAWDFGDGTTDTGMVTTHNYTATGIYTVNLTVTDDDARTDTTLRYVKVGGIIAFFTYSPINPLANQTVTFNATDSFSREGYIVDYTWNFRDGNITATMNPVITHSYMANGIYNVTLTITDNASLTDTTWNIMQVGRSPVAKFIYEPLSPLVNQTVTFNAGQSSDPDGTIVSYAWDFGDGNTTTVTEAQITHVYKVAATCKVTLTVTDNDDFSSDISKTFSVKAKPIASFTYSPLSPLVNQLVTFDASASHDPDGDISIYEWNFGDGVEMSDIDPIITHNYAVAGAYTVSLRVTDNENLKGTSTQSITIAKLSSSISISASPETIKVGEDTTISGSITPVRKDVDVTIYYRLTGEATWNTTTVTTNSTGGYSYTWTPDEAGAYEVKASWLGDANTLGAESSVITVTVEEKAAPPDYLMYVAIVIVVVILAAIAIYFLKFRKP